MAHPAAARLTIDLDALARNYALLARTAVGAETAAVVKSDGYGLGASEVARRLWAEGCRSFFTARLAGGEAVRRALGPDRPAVIFLLDGLAPGHWERLSAARLTPVLCTFPQVEAACALAAAQGRPLAVALHVDTGMNRQGLAPEEAELLANSRERLAWLDIGLLISHLGSADEPDDARNARQLAAFRKVRAQFPEARASLANSSGIFLGPDYHFDMVRPGVSLYGGGPEARPDPRLSPVAILEAPVLDIRRVDAGEPVGYGSRRRVEGATRAAILGAGYADGVIRAAGHGGRAFLGGRLRPLLAVTMDLTIVDLGDAPAETGGMAELLGPNVTLDDLASAAGTVAHEVLVRLSRRAERVYLG
ncbi:MAG: alanine racemase [Phenylobacterium sp.]